MLLVRGTAQTSNQCPINRANAPRNQGGRCRIASSKISVTVVPIRQAADPCVASFFSATKSRGSQLPPQRSMAIVGQVPCEKENTSTRTTEPRRVARSMRGTPFHGSQGISPVIDERAKAPRAPLFDGKNRQSRRKANTCLRPRYAENWGGRWDSNPQQPESQSGTLPLSYGHHVTLGETGLPGRTRTSDPQLRRLMLYPTELRADFDPPGRGLTAAQLVGARGFEPPTPCAQGRCATRLRHTPKRR